MALQYINLLLLNFGFVWNGSSASRLQFKRVSGQELTEFICYFVDLQWKSILRSKLFSNKRPFANRLQLIVGWSSFFWCVINLQVEPKTKWHLHFCQWYDCVHNAFRLLKGKTFPHLLMLCHYKSQTMNTIVFKWKSVEFWQSLK